MASEETEILNGIAGAAKGAGDFMFYAIVGIVIIVTLIISVWYWKFRRSFKHSIMVRERTKGNTDLVSVDTYRYVTVDNVECIQLWSNKQLKPVPPPEALDFKRNGAEFVEAWQSETGELKYVNSEVESFEAAKFKIVEKAVNGNFLDKFVFWLKTFKNPAPPKLNPHFYQYLEQTDKPKGKVKFVGIDTKSKEFYANQHIKALRFKKKDFLTWLGENAGLIVVVFLFLLVVVFWKEITEPMSNVATSLSKVSDNQAQIMQIVSDILIQRQKLEAEAGGFTNKTAPPG